MNLSIRISLKGDLSPKSLKSNNGNNWVRTRLVSFSIISEKGFFIKVIRSPVFLIRSISNNVFLADYQFFKDSHPCFQLLPFHFGFPFPEFRFN